ncbi:hypothetical protein ACOI1A_08845 [Corynebacterium glutamicum]
MEALIHMLEENQLIHVGFRLQEQILSPSPMALKALPVSLINWTFGFKNLR